MSNRIPEKSPYEAYRSYYRIFVSFTLMGVLLMLMTYWGPGKWLYLGAMIAFCNAVMMLIARKMMNKHRAISNSSDR